MAKEPVLVDTWAIIALSNTRDAMYQRAVEISQQLMNDGRPLVTTDWILTEFLGFAARSPNREVAVEIVERLRQSAWVEVVPTTREQWEDGFRLYGDRLDKSWSLVDCISIGLCQRLGITDVFTGDHHFEQAGFRILAPQQPSAE